MATYVTQPSIKTDGGLVDDSLAFLIAEVAEEGNPAEVRASWPRISKTPNQAETSQNTAASPTQAESSGSDLTQYTTDPSQYSLQQNPSYYGYQSTADQTSAGDSATSGYAQGTERTAEGPSQDEYEASLQQWQYAQYQQQLQEQQQQQGMQEQQMMQQEGMQPAVETGGDQQWQVPSSQSWLPSQGPAAPQYDLGEEATRKIHSELRQLQEESALLQEHTRRLHQRALQIQQQHEPEQAIMAAPREGPQEEALHGQADLLMVKQASDLTSQRSTEEQYGHQALTWQVGGAPKARAQPVPKLPGTNHWQAPQSQAEYDGQEYHSPYSMHSEDDRAAQGATALQWAPVDQPMASGQAAPRAAAPKARGYAKLGLDSSSKKVLVRPRKGYTGVSANAPVRQQALPALQHQTSVHFEGTLRGQEEQRQAELQQQMAAAQHRGSNGSVPAYGRAEAYPGAAALKERQASLSARQAKASQVHALVPSQRRSKTSPFGAGMNTRSMGPYGPGPMMMMPQQQMIPMAVFSPQQQAFLASQQAQQVPYMQQQAFLAAQQAQQAQQAQMMGSVHNQHPGLHASHSAKALGMHGNQAAAMQQAGAMYGAPNGFMGSMPMMMAQMPYAGMQGSMAAMPMPMQQAAQGSHGRAKQGMAMPQAPMMGSFMFPAAPMAGNMMQASMQGPVRQRSKKALKLSQPGMPLQAAYMPQQQMSPGAMAYMQQMMPGMPLQQPMPFMSQPMAYPPVPQQNGLIAANYGASIMQRASAVEQQQAQHYQQLEASVMGHLAQRQGAQLQKYVPQPMAESDMRPGDSLGGRPPFRVC